VRIRKISPILVLEDTKVQVFLYCQLNSSSLPRKDCLFGRLFCPAGQKNIPLSPSFSEVLSDVFKFFSPLVLYVERAAIINNR